MTYRNAVIILGAGYGDEGKGVATSHFCRKMNAPLVVRFSGGHQVGHQVNSNGVRHIFSNFGSGTLDNAPTYWSEFCTINPSATIKEGDELNKNGVETKIAYNANAMVTTPYDIYSNQKTERASRHGSVGVGFGATIQRNEDFFKLYVRDLKYPKIRDEKLSKIAQYYGLVDNNDIIKKFKKDCDMFVARYKIVNNLSEAIRIFNTNDLVFEGSQGILLDMDYGFFPNVTRSNTTSKNVLSIIKNSSLLGDCIEVDTYYVTRAYQTRHGNGFMTNHDMGDEFIGDNPHETNQTNEYQGDFRKAPLDLDLLKYAIDCDTAHNVGRKHLFITCLDQVDSDKIIHTQGNLASTISYDKIAEAVGIGSDRNCYCFSDSGDVRVEGGSWI